MTLPVVPAGMPATLWSIYSLSRSPNSLHILISLVLSGEPCAAGLCVGGGWGQFTEVKISCPGHTAAKRKEWDLISAFFLFAGFEFFSPVKKKTKTKTDLLRHYVHTV